MQLLTSVDILDVLVIVTAYRDEFLVFLYPFQIFLRLFNLLLSHSFHRVEKPNFLALPQQPQCLCVFLFQRSEQCTAKRLHVVAHLVSFL